MSTQQLNQNIRQYREDRHICQEAVAFQLGISQSTLSRIETGQRAISNTLLKQVAKALHTTPSVLQTYHLPKTNEEPVEVGLYPLVAQKDLIIASQQAEIAFLRQQLMDVFALMLFFRYCVLRC